MRKENGVSNDAQHNTRTTMTVMGVGDCGARMIGRIAQRCEPEIETIAINTDDKALEHTQARRRIRIGDHGVAMRGLHDNRGYAANAAEDSIIRLYEAIQNTEMVVIVAGMGGSTGTEVAPIIARVAKDLEILTVAVVSMPFVFESADRAHHAALGLAQLRQHVDACVVISNQKIHDVYGWRGMLDVIQTSNTMMYDCLCELTDLRSKQGLIQIDLHDLRTVFANAGEALCLTGVGRGAQRVTQAIDAIRQSPSYDARIHDAKNLIINIATEGSDIELSELSGAVELAEAMVHAQAQIIWGITIDKEIPVEAVRITIIATRIGA